MHEHSEPGDLALRAVGSAATDAALGLDAHLESCARCQSELDQLRAVVASVRTVRPEDYPTPPPPAVWAAVLAELGLAATAPPVDELADRRARNGHSARTTVAVASVAAAAGVIAGVVAGALGAVLVRDDFAEVPAVVASAPLEPLEGNVGGGTVTVRGNSAGRFLEVSVQGLEQAPGVHEVWLLADDGERLVSLGLLEGPGARFAVPLVLDIGDFFVVDVSVESADGNPAHSGNSVLRGRLSG